MVKDYDTALKYCFIDNTEKEILESEKKPIVLMKRRGGVRIPEGIALKNPNLGIMLPYTPIHLLLFYRPELEVLVMTSGNKSTEPIYYNDNEAIKNLGHIADYFLVNNREIHMRTDDSVTRVFMGKEYIIRRSRGYVPLPVTLECTGLNLPPVLACGGELKNTFCLNRGSEFYLSHHIGDLENYETLSSFEEGIEHFGRILNIDFQAAAYDLHPEYISTKYAVSLGNKVGFAVQHHHAHIASCMAENNIYGEVIGVAFDGTGYGEDGNIWGGEFFTGGYKGFKRVAHMEYVRMPGGEMAIKEPWRMAVSYLYYTLDSICDRIDDDCGINMDGVRLLEDIDAKNIKTIIKAIEKGFNSPLTSSMGRLFDAISALLGIRSRISYEGQAAIELENASQDGFYGNYSFSLNSDNGVFEIKCSDIIKGILEDISDGVDAGIIAARFHDTVADIVVECCFEIRKQTGLNRVALSGGVFQNLKLLEKCCIKLREKKFDVYIHSQVPSNDGGIALGQAVMAAVGLSRE
jgi:hydrogenase maturation protein HypF